MVAYVSLSDLLLLPVLIGYTIWWMRDLSKGARVRRWTLGLHIIVYGLAAFYIWAVSLGEIVRAGAGSTFVTWLWTLVLTVAGIAAAEAGIWYGGHRLVLERTGSGSWSYRGPFAIAVFWLALYLTRFSLEDGLLGGYSVFLPSGGAPAGVPLGTFVGVVLVVASLYLVSFGFLLGMSIVVWDRHGQALHAEPERSTPEPPSGTPSGPVPRTPGTPAFSFVSPPQLPAEYQAVSGGFRPTAVAAMMERRAAADPAPDPGAPDPPGPVGPRGRCPACGVPTEGYGGFCGDCGRPLLGSPPGDRAIDPGG